MKSAENWGRLDMKFEIVQLGSTDIDVIDGDRGKNYPHQNELLSYGFCLFLSAKNVTKSGFNFSETQFITQEKDSLLNNGKLKRDDIVITTRGTVGNVALYSPQVPYENIRINSGMLIIRCVPNISNQYLYYVFRSEWFQKQITAVQSGSAQPQLPKSHFLKMVIPLPPLLIQKKIASILQLIDEKIELNNTINNNLLEQIKTICTAWLSDYKPFDGVMPSDWVETPLSDIAEFISGYSYKGTELTDSTIAMATIKNFDRKGGFKLDGYKEIIPSSKLKESQHAELFDTLVAHTDLTQNAEVIGNAEPVMSKSGYDDIVFSMDLVKVLPKKDGVSKFLIAAILQDKKFKAHCLGYVNGTTVLHLSKKALPEYILFLPSDFSTLKPLDEVVTALYKQVSSNISENTYLEELRESLLPKLMSGELDASDIDI